jgi:hypothetical protein
MTSVSDRPEVKLDFNGMHALFALVAVRTTSRAGKARGPFSLGARQVFIC